MSKTRVKQIAMRNAIHIWGVTNVGQLDPIVKLFIEVFSSLMNDNENAIADIKERLLEQIAYSLTPNTLISTKPSHSIMKAMPVEPEMEIGRRDIFYTDMLTNTDYRYDLSDPVKQGELKEELEKRSPELYNYRIVVLEQIPYS